MMAQLKYLLITLQLIFGFLISNCKSVDNSSKSLSSPKSEVDYSVPAFGHYESKINAKALQNVRTDVVPYMLYQQNDELNGVKRIANCVLAHGAGIHFEVLRFLDSDKRLEGFVSLYFGEMTVSTLLNRVCQRVFVPLQESSRTSIMEMTLRTEAFMKDVGCNASSELLPTVFEDSGRKQLPCAFIGHSKGGTIATLMARRCMNETSTLGESGCRRIKEFYSAAGVPLGAISSYLVYRASKIDKSEVSDLATIALANFDFTAVFKKSELFVTLLGKSLDFGGSIYGPMTSNPTWLDLNPGARIDDNGKQRTLYAVNKEKLDKKGWLDGEYSASAGYFDFRGSSKIIGSGTFNGSKPTNANRLLTEAFGVAVALLHADNLKRIFDDGLRMARHNTDFMDPETNDWRYLDNYSWVDYQSGDGLADITSAHGTCSLGGTAVRHCPVFPNINHLAMAGGAKEVLDNFVRELGNTDDLP